MTNSACITKLSEIKDLWFKFRFSPEYLYRMNKLRTDKPWFPEYYRKYKLRNTVYSSPIDNILLDNSIRKQIIPFELQQINVIRFLVDNGVNDHYIEDMIYKEKIKEYALGYCKHYFK